MKQIKVVREKVKVYNFEVKDFHTYFVSKIKIWVHNNCSVNFGGQNVPVYRGGNSLKVKPGEIKIDNQTDLVKTTHGVPLDVDPNTESTFV